MIKFFLEYAVLGIVLHDNVKAVLLSWRLLVPPRILFARPILKSTLKESKKPACFVVRLLLGWEPSAVYATEEVQRTCHSTPRQADSPPHPCGHQQLCDSWDLWRFSHCLNLVNWFAKCAKLVLFFCCCFFNGENPTFAGSWVMEWWRTGIRPSSPVSRHHLDLSDWPAAIPSCCHLWQVRARHDGSPKAFSCFNACDPTTYNLRSKQLPRSCSKPISPPVLHRSANKRGLISFYALIQRALLVLSSTVCFSPCLASDRIMTLASQMEC